MWSRNQLEAVNEPGVASLVSLPRLPLTWQSGAALIKDAPAVRFGFRHPSAQTAFGLDKTRFSASFVLRCVRRRNRIHANSQVPGVDALNGA